MAKKKRITENGEVVMPITEQDCVIGLQKTIKEKLPIVSETQPQQGFVERQAWINVDNSLPNSENEVELNNSIQLENEEIIEHSNLEEEPEPRGQLEEVESEVAFSELEEN